MALPKLSVIMPNYNHAHFLQGALRAILDQSYRPLEIIVIDDCSTDNSVEIIEQIALDNPVVRFFRNDRNRGGIHTTRRALELSSGEYVYIGAVDDRVLPGLFDKSMKLLVQHPEAGVCSTLSAVMNEDGEYRGVVRTPIISRDQCFIPPAQALATLRRHGVWFLGNTAIYRRSALMEAGGFNSALGQYCDAFLGMVLALKYGCCYIHEPLAVWRKVPGSYSDQMSGDVDVMMGIMRTAKELMQSTYRHLFPPEYVDLWEKQLLFLVGTGFDGSSHTAQITGLRRLLEPVGLLDRVFLAGLKFWSTLQHLLTKLYLFRRLRRGRLWQELTRNAGHFADRITGPPATLNGRSHDR